MSDTDIGRIEVVEPMGLTLQEVFPSPEVQEQIATFLGQEIDDVLGQRGTIEEQWKVWRRHRMARPEQESKNYPWEGASNICTNMTMKNTNTVFATVKDKFSRKKPFLMMTTTKPEMKPAADAFGRFLNTLIESKHHINLRKVNLTLLYDLVSMGTEFVKIPFSVKRWKFKRAGQEVDKVVYVGPEVIPLQIDDVICKSHWYDLQRAPWFSIRTRYNEYELKQAVSNGIFDAEAVQKVLGANATDISEGQQDLQEITGADSTVGQESPTTEFDIYETYIFWDLDEDGVPEDLKVWLEPDTGVILRAEFNELGVRDVVRIPYMNVPFQLYGAGVGWMSDQTQEEVDTLRNIRINSLHVSSLQMFVTRIGSKLGKVEFRPLKNVEVENPRDDFIPITFPDVSGPTMMAEQLAKQEGAAGVGASDAMSGQPNSVAKSRVTASGEYLQVERGTLILNSYIQNIEEGYAEIAMMLVYQLVHNSDLVRDTLLPLLTEADQALVTQILDLDVEEIPSLFYFQIQTTDVDMTEDAKRQKAMAKLQMYTQYTQTILQLSSMVQQVPPQIVPYLLRFVVGQTELMEENLKLFGEMSPETYLIETDSIKQMLEQLEAQNAQGQPGGGSPAGQLGQPAGDTGMGGAYGGPEGPTQ